MSRWTVCYSENRIMEIIVEADTQEDAERMVMDGDVDYDTATELDADITNVNDSEFLDDSEISEDE